MSTTVVHQYLTIPDVARTWQTSPDTVRRAISRGELRAIRVGRLIRIRPEDLAKAGKPVTRVSGGGGRVA